MFGKKKNTSLEAHKEKGNQSSCGGNCSCSPSPDGFDQVMNKQTDRKAFQDD